MSTPRKTQAKAVKLTADVIGRLDRKRRKGESYDSMLRRQFGFPSRKGEPQPLQEFFVLPNDGQPLIFLSEAEARGAAITLAVRKGKRKTEAVVTAREVP